MSEFAELALSVGLILLALAVSVAVVALARWTIKKIAPADSLVTRLADDAYLPTQVTAALITVQLTLPATGYMQASEWQEGAAHILVLGTFAAVGWLLVALVHVGEALVLKRIDVPGDGPQERRRRTQILLIRRITVVLIMLISIGAALLTFPQVRTIGVSVLASAGLAGVVLGLAAQSMLKGIFAGIQLAFGDALRIGDIVVVEEEWGHVEEMTLTYVVVRIWDKRRLVLPTTYFTENPYRTWTRNSVDILGTVELDIDFTLPIDPLRTELERLCRECEYWDGDTCVLQVTDAVGGYMRLRALVSAADGSVLWDLRCHVREGLLDWIRSNHPESLPKLRAQLAETSAE